MTHSLLQSSGVTRIIKKLYLSLFLSSIGLISLIICICSYEVSAQKDTRAIMEIYGASNEICVTKSGAIWIATKTGITYYTDNIYKNWHIGKLNFRNELVSGKSFERASFFNADTGFISGFIIGDKSAYDIIYHTVNKGKTWNPITFGGSSWIDACFINENGHAWMSGSSQYIYFSKDYGFTWENKGKVVDKGGFRLRSIYFADDNTGLIGTYGNDLYLTMDNCKNWNKIETPLDQKKYARIYSQERPEFKKVLLFHDWIIVNQEGRIFFTKLDEIDWQLLPECKDFSFDKSNDKLWLISNDLKVWLLNNKLAASWKSDDILPEIPIFITASNGSLYAWFRQDICKISESEYFLTPILTTDIPIQTPERTVKSTFITWGVQDNEIYHSDDIGKNWYRIKRFPFSISNFKVLDDTLAIISDYNYNFYQFNSNTDQYKPYYISPPLKEFLKSPIEKVIFQKGSQGCFHNYTTTITYELTADSLFSVKNYERSKEQKEFPNSFKNSFSLSEINDILKSINENPYFKVKLGDFNISTKDKDAYLEEISNVEEKYKNRKKEKYDRELEKYTLPYIYKDFSFYKTYVDSLQNVNDSIINKILLMPNSGWSTTTNWIALKIINKNNQEILIENSNYEPNAWLLPWTITTEEITFRSTNLDISKFIMKNTPEFISEKYNTNDYLIFQIINAQYRRKIEGKL